MIIELEYQLRDSETRFMLATRENIAVAIQAAARTGMSLENVFLFESETPNDRNEFKHVRNWVDMWASLDEAEKWSWERISTLSDATSTTAVLNYSSGCVNEIFQ